MRKEINGYQLRTAAQHTAEVCPIHVTSNLLRFCQDSTLNGRNESQYTR